MSIDTTRSLSKLSIDKFPTRRKSLFLNALTGQDLLPSDGRFHYVLTCPSSLTFIADLPATAWPCRLLHVKGQREPSLTLDPRYFRSCVRELQLKGYGEIMKNYNPPIYSDAYAALLDDHTEGAAASGGMASHAIREANEKRETFKNWVDLHNKTKENLLRLEQPGFALPEEAIGRANVIHLASIILLSDRHLLIQELDNS